MKVLEIIKFQTALLKTSPYKMLLIILLPALVILAGHYLKTQKTDPRSINVSVVDKDETETSRLVLSRLKENGLLELKDYEDPNRALMRMDIDALFVIRQGFGEKILAGDPSNTVELYYAPGNVTSQLITEIFSKEVMRIYVTEQAIDFVDAEYKKHGADFTEQLRRQAVDYTESFWQNGLTVPVTYEYVEADRRSIAAGPLKTAVTVTLECGLILLLILGMGAGLMRQKEDGVLRRLRLCGFSGPLYCALSMTVVLMFCAASLLAALAFISRVDLWTAHALFFIWAGLFTAVLVGFFRRESAYLTVIPLLAVVISFSGGGALYAADAVSTVRYLGFLNPVYCVMYGSGISVHIGVLIAVLLFQHRREARG